MRSNPHTLNEAFALSVSSHPGRTFVIHGGDSLTYEESYRASCSLASYLGQMGVGRADRVGMLLPRVPELVISMLGMSLAGIIPVPVNYTLSAEEVEGFFTSSGATAAIVHSKFLAHMSEGLKASLSGRMIVVGEAVDGLIPWAEAASARASGFIPYQAALDDTAYLNYTTGTGGAPKGAIATHSNMYWNTRSSVEAMEITSEDRHLCMFASFAHPHEIFARPLYTGGSIVLLEEINPKTIARTIKDHAVTVMMGLAPMYDMMATHLKGQGIDTLRVAESGGMYTNPALNARFMEAFGRPILSVWGSTETSGIALANRPSDFRTDGSAGKPCPHYEVRVVDDEGADVPDGEAGEFAFRGEGVISGYYGNGSFNSHDGWYMSGDIGYRDPEGFFHFLDRRNGMLKVAGLKVYPLQVELALQHHPGIAEVAVIGHEDRLRGVVPKAIIVPRDGAQIDEAELRSFCKGRLADYMVPRKVVLVDALPKIGSGKINKKALMKEHAE